MHVWLATPRWKRGAGDQQEACQPAGNGISGQGTWLSLAALGGALKTGKVANMKSPPDVGAIADRTTSSNKSKSASLIGALPGLECTVAKLFWFWIARIVQIVTIPVSRPE